MNHCQITGTDTRAVLLRIARAKREAAKVARLADKEGVMGAGCGCWNYTHLGRCLHTVN
jgi:hypothetical protein